MWSFSIINCARARLCSNQLVKAYVSLETSTDCNEIFLSHTTQSWSTEIRPAEGIKFHVLTNNKRTGFAGNFSEKFFLYRVKESYSIMKSFQIQFQWTVLGGKKLQWKETLRRQNINGSSTFSSPIAELHQHRQRKVESVCTWNVIRSNYT